MGGTARTFGPPYISCYMAGTIWTLMREYGTAVLVAISCNTAIPVGFSFGPVQDSSLYAIFFNIFGERFRINLSLFRLESDQGSGLSEFARLHGFV
jgi:hypothetical protein